ncbi:MAG: SDR family NAD(P)-dependent oxidoreductase, partial [Planctomycetota bacterium]
AKSPRTSEGGRLRIVERATSTKTILITGCSAGFGRDAALRFARSGHTVHATMRGTGGNNAERATELRNLADGEGLALHVHMHELDVTSDDRVASAVGATG